jgi:HupE / UreJ protein
VKYTSFLLVAVACISFAARPSAHEIPSDVRVQIFVVPKGDRLQVVVRAPIAAMNEIDWPTTGVFLDLGRADAALRQGATDWIGSRIDLYEEDRSLGRPTLVAVRAASNADLSFDSYERARQHVTGPPLPGDTQIALNQALLDAVLEYPIRSDRARFSIAERFDKAGVRSLTILRFLPPGGVERAFTIHDEPGIVRLDPRWFQAAWRFVGGGFFHILDGVDHLLFLLCLVIPFRRVLPLVPVVTAFTVAHSITLIASAYNMAPGALWFPPLVEVLIAVSIVYMALENIAVPVVRRRWIVAFAFGLVHGFGFSFALRENLQFAGEHLLTALLSFNVGVELGQLLVLVAAVPAFNLLIRAVPSERTMTIIVSALIAHTGWHWMTERFALLRRYPLEWPVLDAAFFALLLRWVILAVALGAVAWLIFGVFGARRALRDKREDVPAVESRA